MPKPKRKTFSWDKLERKVHICNFEKTSAGSVYELHKCEDSSCNRVRTVLIEEDDE